MNPIRWSRKWVAVTCSHGHLIHEDSRREVMDFVTDFAPDRRLMLGDAYDLSCLMNGYIESGGGEDTEEDYEVGSSFLREYQPHVLFQGNHEARAFELERDNRASVRNHARLVANDMRKVAAELCCDYVPYTSVTDENCFRRLGNTAFCHGFSYGANAPIDHVVLTGMPTVHGHTHTTDRKVSKSMGGPTGYAIGWLGDVSKMKYAHRHHKTATWKRAIAWGEHGEDWCTVNIRELQGWKRPEIKAIE